MPSLHEEIFYQFKKSAQTLDYYPAVAEADRLYLEKLASWEDVVGFRRFDFPQTPDAEFDTAWLIVPVSRNSSQKNAKVDTMVIGVDSRTGRLSILSGEVAPKRLTDIHGPATFTEIISLLKQNGSLRERSNFATVQRFFYQRYGRLLAQITSKTEGVSASLAQGKRSIQASALRRLMEISADEILKSKFSTIEGALADVVDAGAMRFADRFMEKFKAQTIQPVIDNAKQEHCDALGIYNHLVAAPTPTAMDYRKGALLVLMPTKELFLGAPEFWAGIDAGKSVHVCLGEYLKVQASAVKRVIQKPEFFLGDVTFFSMALCRLDPSYWPQTRMEVAHFLITKKIARHLAEASRTDYLQTLTSWIRDARKESEPWRHIAEKKLQRIIAKARQQIEKKLKDKKSEGAAALLDNKTRLVTANMSHRYVQASAFSKRCLDEYQTMLRSIPHMQNDLGNKMTRAALILALESRGFTAKTELLAPLEKKLSKDLWEGVHITEQITASDYWHSERVNFRDRFKSISHTADKEKSWVALLPGPVKMENGLTLHPLTCAKDLEEEAEAMAHCVWSYAHHCMANRYHIFSVRSGNKRLSTLSVRDVDIEGQRCIRSLQNLAYKNATPAEAAIAAGKELIAKINTKEWRPDWKEIDAVRKGFLAGMLDDSVGYDFRLEEQRERIFALYAPCLPRKLLSGKSKDFDSFSAALGIDKQIDDFITANRERLRAIPAARLPGPAPA